MRGHCDRLAFAPRLIPAHGVNNRRVFINTINRKRNCRGNIAGEIPRESIIGGIVCKTKCRRTARVYPVDRSVGRRGPANGDHPAVIIGGGHFSPVGICIPSALRAHARGGRHDVQGGHTDLLCTRNVAGIVPRPHIVNAVTRHSRSRGRK